MGQQKLAHRALYVIIFTLFILTCYFFILDLQHQQTAGVVDPPFKPQPTRESLRSQQRGKVELSQNFDEEREKRDEAIEMQEIQDRKDKAAALALLKKDQTNCYSTETYMLTQTATSFVRRYIDSYTYDAPYEKFHPVDAYLIEAEKLVQEGLDVCDWSTCSTLCTNTTIFSALLSLKHDRAYEAVGVLSKALQIADSAEQRGRIAVFRGFTAEYDQQLVPSGYMYYGMAVAQWPQAEDEYVAIVRHEIPDDAPREDKMKIYYYGNQEEIIALLDGLLALEFYPENLKSFPILRHNEPEIFWNPVGEKQYKLIKQLMSPFIQTVNAKMMADLIDNGHLDFKDPQATRFFSYNERFSRFFQFNVVGVIRQILGREVKVSYTYFGGYVGGSTLSAHRDRPACEYTMSLVIDSYPHGSTWPLAINKISKEGMTPTEPGGKGFIPDNEENIVRAMLQPGDAFMFQGRHKVHWRDGALADGHYTRVYFYHFVNEDFTGSLL